MTIAWLRSMKWLIALLTGALLFAVGIYVLRLNPYWKADPRFPGPLDHRVYAWNGVGHVISAVGLLGVFASLIFLPSRLFKTKWLYWAGALCGAAMWFAALGPTSTYDTQFTWNAQTGLTDFTVLSPSRKAESRLWQAVVRWQIEPELRGYLNGSGWKQMKGDLRVKVARIVPIALPEELIVKNVHWIP
jgi:hypothetical protein